MGKRWMKMPILDGMALPTEEECRSVKDEYVPGLMGWRIESDKADKEALHVQEREKRREAEILARGEPL